MLNKMYISPSIHYIGADNASAKIFEAQYTLSHGMSYNSYLITDTRTAILDTIDADCAEQWKQNLEQALDGRNPDYLVVHHLEPDHSSLTQYVLERFPDIKIVTSVRAAAMLPQFLSGINIEGRVIAVKDGDTLELGNHTLHFTMAPMIHWPEVMVSYESTEKILFSADAFGKFGALAYEDEWLNEARRYYINIVGKYGRQVSALLSKFNHLEVKAIAPLHGPLLSDNIGQYVHYYSLWSSYTPETEGVLVAYASIYGNTREAALMAAGMLKEQFGVKEVVVTDLCSDDMAEAVAQAFRMDRMILACPTYDGALFPAMDFFLSRLASKGYRSRSVGLIENGSWAPIAAKLMRDRLSAMPDVNIIEPAVTIRSRLNASDPDNIHALCEAISSSSILKS